MEGDTETKLIDFFKCEAPLRRLDHRYTHGRESLDREAGNGRWSEDLKLEPPSDSFWSGNGDGRPNGHRDLRYISSYDDCRMTLKPPQEAVTREQWSVSPPNLALTLLSPSPTGTQASATSPPETPTFDIELNSTRAQPETSLFSADSDSKLHGDDSNSRVRRWSPKTGRKRLKTHHGNDDNGAVMVDRSNVENLLPIDEGEDEEAVVQAAASLLSLSNDDDRSLTKLRRNVSSSSLAVIGEGSEEDSGSVMGKEKHWSGTVTGEATLAVTGEASEKGQRHGSVVGEGSVVGDGSGDGCSSMSSSVLSRPSNKRRYRLVVDVLKEGPKVVL